VGGSRAWRDVKPDALDTVDTVGIVADFGGEVKQGFTAVIWVIAVKFGLFA
jgi:cell division GTPase FtsZ